MNVVFAVAVWKQSPGSWSLKWRVARPLLCSTAICYRTYYACTGTGMLSACSNRLHTNKPADITFEGIHISEHRHMYNAESRLVADGLQVRTLTPRELTQIRPFDSCSSCDVQHCSIVIVLCMCVCIFSWVVYSGYRYCTCTCTKCEQHVPAAMRYVIYMYT